MKQHITIEQLNSLSPKGKQRLRECWGPKYGDWVTHEPYTENPTYHCNGCDEPQLYHFDNDEGGGVGNNYSHPIQDKHLYCFPSFPVVKYSFTTEDFETGEMGWGVSLSEPPMYCKTELCDSLWEATKQVLEK